MNFAAASAEQRRGQPCHLLDPATYQAMLNKLMEVMNQ